MPANSESSACSKPQLSPKAAELGNLSAMRQTMSDFSLDSLSSLLDDELSLDAAAEPAPQPMAVLPIASEPPLASTPPASVPHFPTAGAPTEHVSVTAARLAALTQPPENVRKSSLEETQLYKSTPQPTIDLSAVRRSASEPTQAFAGNLYDHLDASATIPSLVDPTKSSVPEAAYHPHVDQPSADLATVTQPVAPQDAQPEILPVIDSVASPLESVEASENVNAEPSLAPQLAPFFEEQPRRTTDARWEQAVESDRQFTTMLLTEMDELPWKVAPLVAAENSAVPAYAAEPLAAVDPPVADAASFALPATPEAAEFPVLDPAAFDLLEVVGAEQASVASALVPQRLAAPQDAPVPSEQKPKLAEPTPELRELATFLLNRFTPGVSTAVALVGCETTRPGAQAALSLAAAVADATGVSTLIVDGDFANRELSAITQLAPAPGSAELPGFAEVLGEPAKGRSYAQSVSRENLSLLPAGQAMPEASLAPSSVAAWIANAKQEYGLILVWLGIGEGEYATRLCGAADATLLLAAVDQDRPSRIETASERVRSANARTLGVALVR